MSPPAPVSYGQVIEYIQGKNFSQPEQARRTATVADGPLQIVCTLPHTHIRRTIKHHSPTPHRQSHRANARPNPRAAPPPFPDPDLYRHAISHATIPFCTMHSTRTSALCIWATCIASQSCFTKSSVIQRIPIDRWCSGARRMQDRERTLLA